MGLNLSLRLYLDDCAFSHQLCKRLIAVGHDVEAPADAIPPLTGADDSSQLAYARASNRVLLTFNARDFAELHDQQPDHPGILAVYQDNDPSKDMSYGDIVAAIANLERASVAIRGEFWVLNVFQW